MLEIIQYEISLNSSQKYTDIGLVSMCFAKFL